MRTAPGNSFVNPVERIMSILNLGLQGVALERKSVGKYEAKLKACHSISDIRTASEKDPGLKDAFVESVQQPLVKVCDRFNRLQLKDEKVQGLATTATAEQLEELFSFAKQVDSTLTQTDSTKIELSKKQSLKSFMSKHCRLHHYMFQIKKCMDETCAYCLEKQLPGEVISNLPCSKGDASGKYLPYEEVVGTETTDKHRPSFVTGDNKIYVLVSTQVHTTVACRECLKPCCVYSRYVLSNLGRA